MGTFHVDLLIDGGLGDQWGSEKELVGRTVEVDYIFPLEFAAMNVRLVPEEPPCQP
jgi:hypothetical protein